MKQDAAESKHSTHYITSMRACSSMRDFIIIFVAVDSAQETVYKVVV